jgi:hypothetical protein
MRRVLGELLGLIVDDLGLACGVIAAVGLAYGLTRDAAIGSSVLGGVALVGAVAVSLTTSLRRADRRRGRPDR